jgi:hypothetical protein
MIKLSCTRHAEGRARQRIRWHRRTLDRMLERVFYNGLGADDCPKRLHEYIEASTERHRGLTRIYGEHLFLFTRDDPDEAVLLTINAIPSNLKPAAHLARRQFNQLAA